MNCELMKKIDINEVFLPIDDFPKYEVSNYGNVKNIKTGRILKSQLGKIGYFTVTLYNQSNNNHMKLYIHRLVLTAFEINSENRECIDHINNNRQSNCLFNLRYASKAENNRNCSIGSNNVSSIKGVSWNKKSKKWETYVTINCKKLNLGYFDNIEDAKKARQQKANEIYGDYINSCEKLYV